jgi:hypothetical protein
MKRKGIYSLRKLFTMTQVYTKEDDEEISLGSFDSTRSGESHEYERNARGYVAQTTPKRTHVLPPVANAKRIVEKQPKKRRIRPTCLQEKLPRDIETQVGPCVACDLLCNIYVPLAKIYICHMCTQYALGINFQHPKLKLIIMLRREYNIMQTKMNQLGKESNMPAVVDLHSRLNATHRVIAGLVYDNTDLRIL